MKTCTTCKQSKPFLEYHKDRHSKDGHQRMCKACSKAYRQTKKCIVSCEHYRQSTKGKARYKRYASRHPGRIKAKNAVNNAIHRNKLNRPETLHCMDCFEQATEYHHPSYAPENRLSLVPLCSECHKDRHRLYPLAYSLFSLAGGFLLRYINVGR